VPERTKPISGEDHGVRDSRRDENGDPEEEKRLEEALKIAPRGAFALAGTALLLLMLAWFFFYFVVFLPRGVVG
jgi:hypothetical protein